MSTQGNNEYSQFRKTFFEECAEVLADMEGRLEQLQAGPAANDDLNAIFRAVHSIKAGAGAFSFVELVKFSHVLETLLDYMRDGRLAPDERVVATLIRAGDVLSALVTAAQEERAIEPGYGSDVADELQALLDTTQGKGPKSAPADKAGAKTGTAVATEAVAAARTYSIGFRPHSELFRHANEPLLLIRELRRLGSLSLVCDQSRLPGLSAMDPEEAYLGWSITLHSTHLEKDILEVFEFVDQDCDLTVEALNAAAEPEAVEVHAEATSTPAPAAPEDAANMSSAAPERAAADPSQKAARGGVSSIRVDITRIDRLVNMAGELVIAQAMLAQQIADQHSDNSGQPAVQNHADLAALTRELQECVMAIRMQPVKSVFARMPRLVREISSKLGKSVRLVMSGENTEVDKTVIEELADPLTHMIRNAVDHGVETPEIRLAAGKPEEGTIELSASHVGSNILIQIVDDGAGINRERLLRKAISKGVVPAGATLGDDEIDDLLFAPGISTAEAITDFSGRGVGMDVVRRNITNLGGRIQVQSAPGKGTRFTLVIPLTLAVLDGMAVAVGAERYILPLTSIVESFRPTPSQIRGLTGGQQLTSVRGEFFRVIHLDRLFSVPDAVAEPWQGLVVLVEPAGGQKVGIKVDELLGQQQVVIKSLQENFHPVAGISGATILGNGKVALILDIEELASMTERPLAPSAEEYETAGEPKSRRAAYPTDSLVTDHQHAIPA
jgi:two-component system chemotaxis sensor kinase CheA